MKRTAWAILALLATGFLVASSVLFVWPRSDRPQPVGAILMLNGSDDSARAALAASLMHRGLAPVLLFSEGTGGNDCPRIPQAAIVCFVPHPGRTVGEIGFARQYAQAHHDQSILIVSGRAQTTRARLLAHRCFPGRSLVDGAPTHWWQVPGQVLYEWGALIKATLIDQGCS